MRSRKFSWKKFIVGVAVLIVILTFALPPLILSNLNRYLAHFSPGYWAHIDSLELHPWRAAYQFGGLTLKAKKDGFVIVKVENIDVSLAWREILKLKVRTDIRADGVEMFVDKHIYDLAKTGGRDDAENFSGSKKDALKAKNKLFPVDVTRLSVHRSSFAFADKMGLPLDDQLRLTEIDATITRLLPESANQASRIWASGLFMGSAKIKVAATAYLKAQPMEWDADIELRAFDLTKSNGFLQRVGPLSFNSGRLDFFAELKSENGAIEGYAKPFLSRVDIVGNKKDFLGVKHFFVEVFAALADVIFESSKSETVSTKIPITQKPGGAIEMDRGKALAGLFRHAFQKEYTPKIEDSITLTKETK
jgi:hypothetical protein